MGAPNELQTTWCTRQRLRLSWLTANARWHKWLVHTDAKHKYRAERPNDLAGKWLFWERFPADPLVGLEVLVYAINDGEDP